LNVEGGGPVAAERPVFLTDIMNPCWIYPAVDMAGVDALSVSVGQAPFNFQLGADIKKIVLRPPATPDGELDVRLDGCDGEFLAVLPLTPGRLNDGVTTLTAAIPRHAGVHDLCLSFTAKAFDRLWAVNWVQLRSSALASGAGP
jgi:hexosaminidase